MPDICTLHQSKLEDFKSWLDSIGHEHRPTTANYQVLQVKWGSAWQAIYKRNAAPEHLSVPNPLIPLVRRFLRETKEAKHDLP